MTRSVCGAPVGGAARESKTAPAEEGTSGRHKRGFGPDESATLPVDCPLASEAVEGETWPVEVRRDLAATGRHGRHDSTVLA